MPQPASALQQRDPFIQVLLVAPTKWGKSTIAESLITAFGQGLIINCGRRSGLDFLLTRSTKFEWERATDEETMEVALRAARDGVKAGTYKWVAVDDFGYYVLWLEDALEKDSHNDKGEPDGRKYWPAYHKRLGNLVGRLCDLKCHLVVTTHPDVFMGKSRDGIPGRFPHVVIGDRTNKGERVFLINSESHPGYGSCGISGEHTLPADLGAFAKFVTEHQQQQKRAVKK